MAYSLNAHGNCVGVPLKVLPKPRQLMEIILQLVLSVRKVLKDVLNELQQNDGQISVGH